MWGKRGDCQPYSIRINPTIVSECKELAQNDYEKSRHDKVAAILHWQMYQKYGFPTTAKSHEHFVDKEMGVLENENVKLLWDFPFQTELKIDYNRPDLVLLDKKRKNMLHC